MQLPDHTIVVNEAVAANADELALYQRALRSTPTPRLWLHMSEWVMVKLLGRPLRPYEVVRWRNKNRHDHRLENLDLYIRDAAGRERSVLRELVWGRELRERYSDDDEARLQRAAQASESAAVSEPQDGDRNGPSTIASTSASVSPAE